jgi:hypothetical protein
MTMDLSQLTQMTTWLDEEHRRDKAELIRLQQHVESQSGEMADQARLMQDLEGRVASLQGQLLRFGQLEASLQQLKSEVVQLMAQADERREQENRQLERLRAIERDNMSKAVNEIRRDLQRLFRLEEESALRKAEQQRVGEVLLAAQQEFNVLKQEVESKLRSVPFLEDSRQQDGKRIARLQQESLEALKRIEQQGSRLQMLEDVSQRHERDTADLQQIVTQLRNKQREFIDGQLMTTEQLKRQLAEWLEKIQVEIKHIDEFAARLAEFGDAFREDRQVVGQVASFQEQIRREQTQVAELQRLGEERQKHQMETWQEESEKRWKKELLRWDHQVAEEAKRHSQISEQFRAAEERLAQDKVQLDALWKFLEGQVGYHTQESRRWLGEMTRMLEERPKRE